MLRNLLAIKAEKLLVYGWDCRDPLCCLPSIQGISLIPWGVERCRNIHATLRPNACWSLLSSSMSDVSAIVHANRQVAENVVLLASRLIAHSLDKMCLHVTCVVWLFVG